MAEAPAAAPKPANRGLVVVLLVVQMVGTIYFLSLSFWDFMQLPEPHRGPALWNLTYALAWFLLIGWRIRAMTHPKPA